jgi:hypothetical protein
MHWAVRRFARLLLSHNLYPFARLIPACVQIDGLHVFRVGADEVCITCRPHLQFRAALFVYPNPCLLIFAHLGQRESE